jgi:hypothetical protein
MKQTYSISKISDLNDRIAPGFDDVWRAIKAETKTTVRCPKRVTVTDEPSAMYPNDHDCAARFVVDLASMQVLSKVHVSAGEWAIANKGQDKAISDIPQGQAVVSCCWNSYYRYFDMSIEVAPGTLKAQLTE